jgi:FdhD protein
MSDMTGDRALPGHTTRQLLDGNDDRLIREEPLLLVIEGQQLMTMRTPGADDDLAMGFLLGEGVIESPDQVYSTELRRGDPQAQVADELTVSLRSAPDQAVRGLLTRTHEIRSSCGVCGVADPEALLEHTRPLLPGVPRLDHDRIVKLISRLGDHQPLFHATGGCHAALVCDADGVVLGCGEDVGRHNALDKAIGMAARSGHALEKAVAVLSGRAGYDLVMKCLRVGIPVVISVSAPSALAFDLCAGASATLIGFARGASYRVYCDGGRRLPGDVT